MNMVEISSFLQDNSSDRWFPAFITVLGSGLRIGELTALKWSKIDLQKGVIFVNEAVSRVRNGIDPDMTSQKSKLIFQTPKTKKGIRNISLPSMLSVN